MATGNDRRRATIAAIGLLADELRHRLYRFVRGQHTPVTRDQAAAATGISRKLAGFHLDKLVTAGLLQTATADPASRQPGPGRAPKAYRPVSKDHTVSIPERRYELLGDVLAQAILADGPAGTARQTASRIAEDRGRALGERIRTQRRLGRLGPERALTVTGELLDACGYEPSRPAPHLLVLRNCPFQRLARTAPELVCMLNRDFLAGLLHGLHARRVEAVLKPDTAANPGRCCVQLHADTN